MSNPIAHKVSLKKQWQMIFRLNEIPRKALNDRDMQFVRSVTRQFQDHEALSSSQWIAIQRCIDYYMPECDFDPNNPEGI